MNQTAQSPRRTPGRPRSQASHQAIIRATLELLLEIGVDIDYEFRLDLPDERYHALDSVEQTVDLVCGELAARSLAGDTPEVATAAGH